MPKVDLIKVFLLSITLTLLISCGGDSSEEGEDDLIELSLLDLHGFWIAKTDLEGSTHIFIDTDEADLIFVSDMGGCWGEDSSETFVFDAEEQTILVNSDINDITYDGTTL